MVEEFDLSEEEQMYATPNGWKSAYPTDKVKEFIKQTEKDMIELYKKGSFKIPDDFIAILKKRAGAKLTK